MLTGKLTKESKFENGDHRLYNRHGEAFDRGETFSGLDYDRSLAVVDKLKKLLPIGMTLTQMALRWILMFPEVTCTIPGAKRPAQVEENVAAADLHELPDEVMREIEKIYNTDVKKSVHHYW